MSECHVPPHAAVRVLEALRVRQGQRIELACQYGRQFEAALLRAQVRFLAGLLEELGQRARLREIGQ